MSDTGEIVISQDWVSGDYSNIITISSAAIASVLLVIFKSRCSNISICFGLLSCNRKVAEEDEENPDPDPPPGGAMVNQPNPPQAQAPDPVQNP